MICWVSKSRTKQRSSNMFWKSHDFTRSAVFSLLILLILPSSLLISLEIPLEFHGGGLFGKYLNSDTSRYNVDASVELYCTVLRGNNLSMFVLYRDDLDMAEQKHGVRLDPRYAHYYIVGGLDYFVKNYVVTGYFMHDCVHDIDYYAEGTPVFNRFRLKFAPSDFHYSTRLKTPKRFLWSIDLGYYPHVDYSGWDINSGADYQYDAILELMLNVFRNNDFGVDAKPSFAISKGDSTFYHRHLLRFMGYYKQASRRIGFGLDYNLYNTDPIKNPDKLWLLYIYLEF
jgi:hypothetical protein